MSTRSWELRAYQAIAAILVLVLLWVLFRGHISGDLVIFFACAIPSVILHEIAHGWVALAFGDDTAKRAGRLTLNPLSHIDPFGTILLPVMMLLVGLPVLAYAKPVPVNVSRLRRPRNQWPIVALAGPATNGLLMGIATLLLRYPAHSWLIAYANDLGGGVGPSSGARVAQVLVYLGEANILLGLFNLLPIPPLDGSAVLERLLPRRAWPAYLKFRRYSMILFIVIFVVVLSRSNLYDDILNPVFNWWQKVILS